MAKIAGVFVFLLGLSTFSLAGPRPELEDLMDTYFEARAIRIVNSGLITAIMAGSNAANGFLETSLTEDDDFRFTRHMEFDYTASSIQLVSGGVTVELILDTTEGYFEAAKLEMLESSEPEQFLRRKIKSLVIEDQTVDVSEYLEGLYNEFAEFERAKFTNHDLHFSFQRLFGLTIVRMDQWLSGISLCELALRK